MSPGEVPQTANCNTEFHVDRILPLITARRRVGLSRVQHVNSPWLELTEVGQEAHAYVCVLLAVLVLDHFPHFCELSVMSEIDL